MYNGPAFSSVKTHRLGLGYVHVLLTVQLIKVFQLLRPKVCRRRIRFRILAQVRGSPEWRLVPAQGVLTALMVRAVKTAGYSGCS